MWHLLATARRPALPAKSTLSAQSGTLHDANSQVEVAVALLIASQAPGQAVGLG